VIGPANEMAKEDRFSAFLVIEVARVVLVNQRRHNGGTSAGHRPVGHRPFRLQRWAMARFLSTVLA
jgi:hypothetical protein